MNAIVMPRTAAVSPGRLVIDGLRLWLGAWMIVNGVNYWWQIFPQPVGSGQLSAKMLVTMMETGMFGIAKVVEIGGGVLLILNRFVPATLLALLPVSAIVFFNGGILNQRLLQFWFRGLPYMGTMSLYVNVVLVLAYFRHYVPALAFRAAPGKPSDLALARTAFDGDDGYGWRASLVSLAVAAAMMGVIAWNLTRDVEWNAGAGKVPHLVIKDYLALAYDQGRGAEATKLYFKPDTRDDVPDAIDRQDGAPIPHEVHSIVAEGQNVVVSHRIGAARGQPAMEAVDRYLVKGGRILERHRVAQVVADASAVAAAP